MNYKQFNNYLNTVMNAMDAQERKHDETAEKTFLQAGIWALHRLERLFNDQQAKNIRRWLAHEPCVYRSDVTGDRVQIQIGPDREAFYYFLVFCKRIKENREIDDDFRDFLMYLLRQSSSKNWEEC